MLGRHLRVWRRLAVEAELLDQRIDLVAGHFAEWDALRRRKGGVSTSAPLQGPSPQCLTSSSW